MATTDRMLQLLGLLQARRDWRGPELSARLDVSERTVRRDVDRLRDLGYRVRAIKGPDGGYRLDAGSELPPLLFDDDQAVVLATALQAVATIPDAEDAATRALATVRQTMPARLRHRVDLLTATSTAAPARDAAAVPAEVLSALATAIQESKILRLDHRRVDGPQAPAVPRRVEPHRLVSRAGRWYLVAWDLDRADWRVFRADRVDPRSPLGASFRPRAIPGGDAAAFVEGRLRGSADGDGWPCRGSATLACAVEVVAPYLRDGTVEAQGEGTCRLTLGAWSWTALASRIGAFDVDISDARPEPLAEAFHALARRFSRADRRVADLDG